MTKEHEPTPVMSKAVNGGNSQQAAMIEKTVTGPCWIAEGDDFRLGRQVTEVFNTETDAEKFARTIHGNRMITYLPPGKTRTVKTGVNNCGKDALHRAYGKWINSGSQPRNKFF